MIELGIIVFVVLGLFLISFRHAPEPSPLAQADTARPKGSGAQRPPLVDRPGVRVPHTTRRARVTNVTCPGLVTVQRRNFISADEFAQAGFDYTVRPYRGWVQQLAENQGGWAEVLIRLFDKEGHSFLTRRKIHLN